MHNRFIVTIATGKKDYLEMAINLSLSIKSNNRQIKTVLLTDNMDWINNPHFDIVQVFQNTVQRKPADKAMFEKLQVYSYDFIEDGDEVLILDADTIVLPGKDPHWWFMENAPYEFNAYNNGHYDFATKTYSRTDYEMWCDPEDVRMLMPEDAVMPQINASFIFFTKNRRTNVLFELANSYWYVAEDGGFKYNRLTEELCLNMACAATRILPPKEPYRPIFFQYHAGFTSMAHVHHYYKAMGFAGVTWHDQPYMDAYNEMAQYYRELNGVKEKYEFTRESKMPEFKVEYLELPYLRRVRFASRGDLPNSGGGIYNPGAVKISDERILVVSRKESDYRAYQSKMDMSTCNPVLFLMDNEGNILDSEELDLVGFPLKCRVEDFRPFETLAGEIYVVHTCITEKEDGSGHYIRPVLSKLHSSNTLEFYNHIELPLTHKSVDRTEKNWVFYVNPYGLMVYIYQLDPFVQSEVLGKCVWRDNIKIDWFHKEGFLANSTNPIYVDGMLLMWFHTHRLGRYYHGALLFSPDFKEYYYTSKPILLQSENKGYHKGLNYISSCVYLEKEGIIRVFYGEGDANSCFIDYDKVSLLTLIKQDGNRGH